MKFQGEFLPEQLREYINWNTGHLHFSQPAGLHKLARVHIPISEGWAWIESIGNFASPDDVAAVILQGRWTVRLVQNLYGDHRIDFQ